MELKDIITKPEDRVFIIAPECFIIFTGDDTDDERSLIRIGSGKDLPREAIPLIENIIVPDVPTGNPLDELRSLDHASPGKNRYIGSSRPLRDTLDFLKACGADTGSMAVMEIEQEGDITEERAISRKGTYTGIFYRDGNFRVKIGKDILFDLLQERNRHCTDMTLCAFLAGESDEGRYRGKGFITLAGNPCVYGNGYFTLHGVSPSVYREFHCMGMDPSLVQGVVLPRGPVEALVPLLKWKHGERRRLRLFTHDTDTASLLGRLYPDCALTVSPLQGMEYSTGEGIIIGQMRGSASLLVQYRNALPARADVNIAFVTDYAGLEGALKSRAHALLISGTVYDGAAPLLKDAPVPLFVSGESRLADRDGQVVRLPQLVQYEMRIYEDMDSLLKDVIEKITGAGRGGLLEEWPPVNGRTFMKALPGPENLLLEDVCVLENLRTMLRIEEETKSSPVIRKILAAMEKKYPGEGLAQRFPGLRRIELAIYGDGIYCIHSHLVRVPLQPYPLCDDTEKECEALEGSVHGESRATIIRDRERLRQLLLLYYRKNAALKKKLNLVTAAIPRENVETGDGKGEGDKNIIDRELRRLRAGKIVKVLLIAAVPFILAALLLGGYRLYSEYREHEEREAVARKAEAEKNRVADIIRTYNVHVSDYDIFLYANQVAVKNGYAPIEMKNLKKKNPNWIFPGNVFVLLDGERITVVEGNTLWGISERKLMKRHIDFYSVIDELKDDSSGGAGREEKLKKARGLAFSRKHFEILERMAREKSR